jgi:hypothetical protein
MLRISLCSAALCAVIIVAPAVADARTKKVNVSPITDDGTLKAGYRAVQVNDGGTCSPSVFPGVWRCMPLGGGGPVEPCWAAASGPESAALDMTCMFEPWTKDVYLFERLDGIPNPRSGKKRPWGLKLAGGAKCRLATGASSRVNGKRVNFVCGQLSLLGNPNRSRRTWRIPAVRFDSDQGRYVRAGVRRIRVAWFPAPDR